MNYPFVSVIVPCRNEEKYFARCLDSIIANSYPKERLEVLVMDGMSEDGTRDIIRQYMRVNPFLRLLDNPKRTTPCALNVGVTNARGDIIVRMDAHATYEREYIEKCVRLMQHYNADNVGGTMITVPRDNTLVGKAIVISLSHRFGVGNSTFRVGTKEPTWVDTVFGGCYKRELFERVGLFNEQLTFTQDLEFNRRLRNAGGKILLAPEIMSHYHARSSFKSFVKHNLNNGVWAILPIMYSSTFPVSWRHLIPLAFVMSLIGSGLLALLSSLPLPLLLVVGSYTLASIFFSARIALEKKDIRYAFLMPVVFGTLHSAYGMGSLKGVLKMVTTKQFWNKIFKYQRSAGVQDISKRILDLVGSLSGLLALAPILALCAVAVKLGSRGSVFYRGVRVGQYGKPFRMYKFRTMVQDAERVGGTSTPDDDPRITKVGKVLRAYKLDELPQLINVLRGEMSLVGPRPQVPWAVALYSEAEKTLLNVRPGITDLASIKFRNEAEILEGSTDPDRDYLEKIAPEKIRLGLEYVRERSLMLDMKIIAMTLKALVR